MPEIILFNKPFGVLSQFTDDSGRRTLADYLDAPRFRPAGRLDFDSEGLLVLCEDARLQQRIAEPRFKLPKTYLVQVEGTIDEQALVQLRTGLVLNDGMTRPAAAQAIEEPPLWPRQPPIRVRAAIADSWLSLTLTEGRNRQVRRMTAAVGFPTLRLVRWQIGPWSLEGLASGDWRRLHVHLPDKDHAGSPRRRSPRRARKL